MSTAPQSIAHDRITAANAWGSTFTATSRPSLVSVARYTSPMPPDGKLLLFTTHAVHSRTSDGVWALPLTPAPAGAPVKPFPVLQSAFLQANAQFSPDGRWIAYSSNEGQQFELYITAFPVPAGGPGAWR